MAPSATTAASGQTVLHAKIQRAYIWTIIGSTARYGMTFGLSLLLTRLLTPVDYGLLGMMTVFTELMLGIFDAGLSQAVVHFQSDRDEALATYFTTSLLLGAAATLTLFLAAPAIAALYNEPRLISLLRVMSVNLTFGSVRCISAGLLSRDLKFKQLSYIEIGSALFSGVVSITLALCGAGVWSLIAGACVLNTYQTAASCWYVRPKFAFRLDRCILSRLWRYSAPLVGGSLLFKFYENSDYLVVGKVLGPAALGFYALAFRLTMLLNDRVSAVINRVAFPTFATLKDDPQRLIEHWFVTTKRVMLVTFPLLVALAISGDDFIRVILGPRWLPAVVPLRFLCVMAAVKILTNIVGQILAATGHTRRLFRFEVITAVSLPVAFYLGCTLGGILGVGIAWCFVFPLIRLFYLLSAKTVLHFTIRDYVANLYHPAALTLLCSLAILPIHGFLPPGALRLTISAIAWSLAVVVYCTTTTELREPLFVGLRWVRSAASRLMS